MLLKGAKVSIANALGMALSVLALASKGNTMTDSNIPISYHVEQGCQGNRSQCPWHGIICNALAS